MTWIHIAPQRLLLSPALVRAWLLPVKFAASHRRERLAGHRRERPQPTATAFVTDDPVVTPFRPRPQATPEQESRAGDAVHRAGASAATPDAAAFVGPARDTSREVVVWVPPPRANPLARPRLRAALITAAALVLTPAVAIAGVWAFAASRVDDVMAKHQRLVDADTGVRLVDQSGRLTGVLPQDDRRAPPGGRARRLILRAESVPEIFVTMLVAVEDRHSEGLNWRHHFGVDVYSLISAKVCQTVKAHAPVLWSGRCGGSSSLQMQAVRGSLALVGGGDAGEARTARKMTEVLDTLSLSLVGRPSDPQMATFIADRLIYGFGQGAYIWGLATAAEIVFGAPTDTLSDAQLAILVAAPRVQLRMVCPGASAAELQDAQARWARIRTRADFALRSGLPKGARLDAARRELAAMAMPRPHGLNADLVAGLSDRDACVAAANLAVRGDRIASSATAMARPEIVRLAAVHGPLRDAELTLDVMQNRTFRDEAQAALRSMDAAQRHRLRLPLLGPPDTQAEVLLVVTDAQGEIRQYYASNARPMLEEPRRAGSLGKIAVALAAAGAGRSVDDPLCNRRDPQTGVRNADGDAGSDVCAGAALRTWPDAFGRSQNLPVLDLARSLEPARLQTAATDFGLVADPSRLPNAVTLGEALITPRRAVANAQALASGLAGRPAVGYAPHIIRRVRTADGWVEVTPTPIADLQAYFSAPASRAVMEAASTSALRVPGGTLQGALDAQAPRAPGEVGKTGTVEGPPPHNYTVAKFVMGGGVGPAERAYVGLVAPPRGELGTAITTTPLWRVLRTGAARTAAIPAAPASQTP